MEEGQDALFHWPSSWNWHHKNNDHGNSFSFEDPWCEIARDTNSNTSQSANVSQGLRLQIKIKGPSPKAAPNNNSNVCHVCNQVFTSPKSLGGHMRMHSLSKKKDHNVRKVSSCVEKPTCYLCGKTFSSNKSLFGHMRVHPESVRKGIETPTSFDSSESLWGQSSTGKRSRKRDKGLEQGFEVDLQMQEAAYTLMLMSKGNLGSDHVDDVSQPSIFPLTKKRRIEEKSLAMVGNEKGSLQSNFGSNLPAPDQLQHHYGNRTPMHWEGDDHEDRICHNTFSIGQANWTETQSQAKAMEKGQNHYGNNTPMLVGGIKATAEEHDQGQICNKTFSVIDQANTQPKEKGQNGFQIFIGHYDQAPTMDKGE